MPGKSMLKDGRRASIAKNRPPKAKRVQMLVPYQYKPGQSGNPGGRSIREARIRAIAQHLTEEGVVELGIIGLDRDPGNKDYKPHGDVRAQIAALSVLFDRAWGKPKEEEVEELQVPKPDVRKLTPKQREQLVRLVRHMLGKDAADEVDDEDEDES